MTKNFYQILGVSPNETQNQIKSVFRNLAKKYHPDNNPNEQAHKLMKDVTQAYEVLSDINKRKVYDQQLNMSTYVGDKSKAYSSYKQTREESESDFDDWISVYLKNMREKTNYYDYNDRQWEKNQLESLKENLKFLEILFGTDSTTDIDHMSIKW